MRHGYYTVAPRYTCGSPALVDGRTAERVAKEEQGVIDWVLQGYEGEERRLRAEKLGLRGIAEFKIERGSGRKHGWEVHDLCTGERFFQLTPDALYSLGWKRYDELAGWEQRLVDASLPEDIADPKKAFYKLALERHFGRVGFGSGYRVEVYRPEPLA